MKLTAQQVATFNQDGFLIARDALQETDLQPVINELTEFIDARANVLFSEGKIDNVYKEEPFEKKIWPSFWTEQRGWRWIGYNALPWKIDFPILNKQKPP